MTSSAGDYSFFPIHQDLSNLVNSLSCHDQFKLGSDQKVKDLHKQLSENNIRKNKGTIKAEKRDKSFSILKAQGLINKNTSTIYRVQYLSDINKQFKILIEDLDRSRHLLNDDQKAFCHDKLKEIKRLSLELQNEINELKEMSKKTDQTSSKEFARFKTEAKNFEKLFEKVAVLSSEGAFHAAEAATNQDELQQQLYDACQELDVDKFRAAIKSGVDINKADDKGNCLHFLISLNRPDPRYMEFLKVFLETKTPKGEKIDVNHANARGMTPLVFAIYNNAPEVMRILVSHGANINQRDSKGDNLLMWAMRNLPEDAQLPIIKAILELRTWSGERINIEQTNYEGVCALQYAISKNYPEIVEELVKAGADVNQVFSKHHETPLYEASRLRDPEIFYLLLQYGANPHVILPDTFGNPLSQLHAIRRSREEDVLVPVDFKKFSNIDDFSKREAQDVLYRMLLSHTFSLKGSSQVVVEELLETVGEINLEGFTSQFLNNEIANSFILFSERYPNTIDSKTSELLSSSFRRAADWDQNTLFSRTSAFQRGEPLLVPSGFKSHGIGVLFFKDRFVICNRGAGNRSLDSVFEAYTIDPSKVTSETISSTNSQRYNNEEESIKFLSKLPRTLGRKQAYQDVDLIIERLKVPFQTVGNCAYANFEGLVLVILILNELYEISPDLSTISDEKVDEVRKKQWNTYQNWRSFMMLNLVSKYIELCKQPDRMIQPDMNLLSQAMAVGIAHSKTITNHELQADWQKAKQQYLSVAPREKVQEFLTNEAAQGPLALISTVFGMFLGSEIQKSTREKMSDLGKALNQFVEMASRLQWTGEKWIAIVDEKTVDKLQRWLKNYASYKVPENSISVAEDIINVIEKALEEHKISLVQQSTFPGDSANPVLSPVDGLYKDLSYAYINARNALRAFKG